MPSSGRMILAPRPRISCGSSAPSRPGRHSQAVALRLRQVQHVSQAGLAQIGRQLDLAVEPLGPLGQDLDHQDGPVGEVARLAAGDAHVGIVPVPATDLDHEVETVGTAGPAAKLRSQGRGGITGDRDVRIGAPRPSWRGGHRPSRTCWAAASTQATNASGVDRSGRITAVLIAAQPIRTAPARGSAPGPRWTCMRPSSAQRCSFGNTLPGLRSLAGSKAHFTAAAGRGPSRRTSAGIRSRFSTPTPCSPVSTPPTSTQRRRMSAPNASARSSSPARWRRRGSAGAGCRRRHGRRWRPAGRARPPSPRMRSALRPACRAGWCRPCSNNRARCGPRPGTRPCGPAQKRSRSSSLRRRGRWWRHAGAAIA